LKNQSFQLTSAQLKNVLFKQTEVKVYKLGVGRVANCPIFHVAPYTMGAWTWAQNITGYRSRVH